MESAGGEDGFKGGASGGGDLEPTHGAGPCLEDLGELGLDESEMAGLWFHLSRTEYSVVDVLLGHNGNASVYVRCIVGPECLKPVELHAELCGELAGRGLSLADEPEVVRVILKREGGVECVELVSDFNPPIKALNLIRKIGVTDRFRIEAYRPVEGEQ